eukprot:CAMPEP_0113536392 /NCGR_PEP_ID=MMETSP0015_2-20120614/6232_1 /TAXON_ID=2838 /ORGANISM="Odontella" /LENGTH=318 /DNA_ID=CAMNT_0000435745 /DNA_START=103 /DNA_END=1059 /DNA_ORIENTATION=- /assembly_acc=CAM_ASM_000160
MTGLALTLAGLALPSTAFLAPSGLPSAAFRPRTALSMSVGDGSGKSITVFGGTGFVGSRVCKYLIESGADVTVVSKEGGVPSWCSSEEWTKSVEWKSNNLVRGPRESLLDSVGSPDAVVSTVGAIGFDVQSLLLGNGVANAEAAKASKEKGASKFVYVSVASAVSDCNVAVPAYFKNGYFRGKQDAEAAIVENFGEEYCFVKPSFIYGGDSFGLFPPRVTDAYGSFIDELLSKELFKFLADLLPGLLGVVFLPPVSVDAVAKACAGAAIGAITEKVLDGSEEINKAADQPAATGLTDFIGLVSEKVGEAKEKVKDANA